MSINSEKQSNNNGLKAIIVILSLLLIGSLAYMYKLTQETNTTVTTLTSEKQTVMNDLAAAKQTIEENLALNTSLSDELEVEKNKVQQLIQDLDNLKSTDNSQIEAIKIKVNNLKLKIANLLKQIDQLKKENANLNTTIDSTKIELNKSKRAIDTLAVKNDYLSKKIEKGSKLSIVNLQISAVKQKSNGKQIVTDKASRVNVLKISFTIAENQIAKSSDKEYYVQIIDSKNNILGDKEIHSFGNKLLTYSFISSIRYENKTVKVEKDLPVTEIKEGTFFVNVFDSGELVAKSSFTLK